MLKAKNLFLILFILFFPTLTIFAQTPTQLFQQALLKENGEGDLKTAIEIYEKIVKDKIADREIQAKAQLHIGMCWEKMGKNEAVTAYQKVITEYSDQKEVLQLATERLKQMELVNSEVFKPTYKMIVALDSIHIAKAATSPNGKWIAIMGSQKDSRNIWLFQKESDQLNSLLQDFGEATIAQIQWSPTGNYLTYLAPTDNGENINAIWIASIDQDKGQLKGEPQAIVNNHYVAGFDWHPIKPQICFVTSQMASAELPDELSVINVENNKITPLLTKKKIVIPRYSADGDYIYYATHPAAQKSGWDLFQFDIKTNKYELIAPSQALLVQSPQRDFCIIGSIAQGRPQILLKGMKTEEAIELVLRKDMQFNSISFSPNGQSIVLPAGEGFSAIKKIDLKSGTIQKVTTEKGDFSGVQISPDGKYLIYQERKPNEKALHIRNLVRETEQIVPLEEYPFIRGHWSPDAKYIAYKTKQELRLLNLKNYSDMMLAKHFEMSWDEIKWSNDSQWISCCASDSSKFGSYIVSLSGQQKIIDQSGEYISPADWLGNSNRIIYSIKKGAKYQVIQRKLSGENVIILETDEKLQSPVVSPNEELFAVAGGTKGDKLFVASVKPQTQLKCIGSAEPTNFEGYRIHWFPDSRHMIAIVYTTQMTSQFHQYSIDGSEDKILGPDDHSCPVEFCLSPDGDFLYYAYDYGRSGELWEVDVSEAIQKLK